MTAALIRCWDHAARIKVRRLSTRAMRGTDRTQSGGAPTPDCSLCPSLVSWALLDGLMTFHHEGCDGFTSGVRPTSTGISAGGFHPQGAGRAGVDTGGPCPGA